MFIPPVNITFAAHILPARLALNTSPKPPIPSDSSSNISNSNNEEPIPVNNPLHYNQFPSFNLVNILLQQEEIEYQQAIIRSLSEN